MGTTIKKARKATTIRFNDDYTVQMIDTAASLLRQSRTAFLLQAALERAETVIRERYQSAQEIELLLSEEASLELANTLEKPPKPNQKLIAAMQNYKKICLRTKGNNAHRGA